MHPSIKVNALSFDLHRSAGARGFIGRFNYPLHRHHPAANSGSGSHAPLSAAIKVASSAAYGIMSRSLIGARYGRSRRIFSVNLAITSSAAIVSS